MRSAAIVEIEIAAQCLPNLGNRLVAVQVNLLVLDRFPESLYEDVIPPATLAIHADLNALILKQADEGGAGELATLISVHDVRSAVPRDGFLQGVDAGISGQTVRQAPGQHPTGCPIEDGTQIDKAPAHRDVRRIHSPDLVRALNAEITKQVGVDAVRLVSPTGIGLAVNGLNIELLHQRTDMLAADLMAFQLEHVAQHPRPGKGVFQVQFISPSQQHQIAL